PPVSTTKYFHTFPSDAENRHKWIVAIRRENFTVTPHIRVCSRHFKKEDVREPESKSGRRLLKKAVPLSRPGVWERRKRPTEDDTPVKEADTLPGDHDYASAPDPAAVDLVLEENTLLREEILQLKQQIEKLTLEHRFGIHRFAGSDSDIRFYTSSTGSLGLAVKELREKARRALFTIKKSIQFDIPITICLTLFKSVIEPIALYSSEVWGPLTQNDFTSWDRHPTEALHTEFCRNILHVQRKVPNTACRAELGQYPLLLNIPRRALNFWKHIKSSDPQSLHYRALASQELNTESSPLSQLVLKLSDLKPNDITNSKHPHHTLTQKIKTSQIITHQKHNYTNYWTQTTQHQHKLQVYSALNRDYTLAPYLTTIRDQTLRRVMTRYRLSEHSLAIETGRRRQNWVPREARLCSHCELSVVETELHFLTECSRYESIRTRFYETASSVCPEFQLCSDPEKLPYILG
ncbi:hypothetical protein NFI96_009365, partial [Prochilodus magdalenae]